MKKEEEKRKTVVNRLKEKTDFDIQEKWTAQWCSKKGGNDIMSLGFVV